MITFTDLASWFSPNFLHDTLLHDIMLVDNALRFGLRRMHMQKFAMWIIARISSIDF